MMTVLLDDRLIVDVDALKALYWYVHPDDKSIDVYAVIKKDFTKDYSEINLNETFETIEDAKQFIKDTVGKLPRYLRLRIFPSGNAVQLKAIAAIIRHDFDGIHYFYADIGVDDNILVCENSNDIDCVLKLIGA